VEFHYAPGVTPLHPDEVAGLVSKHMTTQDDLKAWEQVNIALVDRWAARPVSLCRSHAHKYKKKRVQMSFMLA
jgi:hypothetical protein